MKKEYLTWEQLEGLVERLVRQLPRDYDAILVITRGGMVPGCLISEKMDIRNILVAAVMFYTDVGETLDHPLFLQFPPDPLLAGKRILIVDDIWDSGRTAVSVKERVLAAGAEAELAVIHYKPRRSLFEEKPDYYVVETDAWIVYPWDREEWVLTEE
ncbi:MAG TPA: phosphoribosyltransferase [Anaerolineae bacterium]|nr:phosphoribosyltransferase [Anaerolineae bacterium]